MSDRPRIRRQSDGGTPSARNRRPSPSRRPASSGAIRPASSLRQPSRKPATSGAWPPRIRRPATSRGPGPPRSARRARNTPIRRRPSPRPSRASSRLGHRGHRHRPDHRLVAVRSVVLCGHRLSHRGVRGGPHQRADRAAAAPADEQAADRGRCGRGAADLLEPVRRRRQTTRRWSTRSPCCRWPASCWRCCPPHAGGPGAADYAQIHVWAESPSGPAKS